MKKNDVFKSLMQTASSNLSQTQETFSKVVTNHIMMEKVLESLPDIIFETELVKYYLSYDLSYLQVDMPWNMPLWEPIKAVIEEAGWQIYSHGDNRTTNGNEWYYYIHSNFPGIRVDFSLNTGKEGSTCKMVPLRIRRVIQDKVEAYERICPDQHPEMFDAEGNYIGDEVFPQIIDETKPAKKSRSAKK